jgi:probable rRNA maturation factor
MALEIHNLQSHLEPDLDLIARAIETASGEKDPEISISIVDDPTIRELNKDHLSHDRPTDVIAFDYREGDTKKLVGEIIVSGETALRVARQKGLDPKAELILYLLHGTLHLKGMDDGNETEAAEMWRLQALYMKELGFNDPIRP